MLYGALPAIALSAASMAAAQAPDITEGWHALWEEVVWDITIIGVLFAVMTLYLLIRFRRSRAQENGSAKPLTPLAAFGWVMIPVFIFMADDIYLAAKNFELWNQLREVPANSYVVDVDSGMWSWDFRHPDGITETNELHVASGRPVHIKLTSRDVVHSFFIPDYKVKWDAVPGRTNYLWFNPKEAGEHIVTCTEFCGTLHSSMFGKIIVMEPAEFEKWLEANRREKI
ncbi:MAG: cytochrome c oxidase subunit II [Deltaproteobacteria bacterium RIFCSPLOWO2_02_FULL_53_8]|nr:MAG: cytochrome c oxidase subunit II [Deltaproteobacteria bacterium RIFCSPLOWO2_02_FULL_53_8]